jgi:miniconductance mechanosensitive channel
MRFMNDPSSWIFDFFYGACLSLSLAQALTTITLVVVVGLLSWMANWLAKLLINTVVTRIVKRTKSQWDDIFLEQKVFSRLSHLAPAWVIWSMAGWALKDYSAWMIAVHKMAYTYMVFVGMIVMLAFVEAWHQIYNTLAVSKHRHIKGYVQLVKIIIIISTILAVIAWVLGIEIGSVVAAMGAMAAVLILVFKDTLLGLVASIQLSADNMVRVGDWISIPKRDVDGIVTDITLNSVMVQNFDKTIMNIPTYSLVNESFQNWKGMEESGVRQIKRSIFIDMRSIRFLDKELSENLSSLALIKEYIESHADFPEKTPGSHENGFLGKPVLTNLAVFRFYAEAFVRQHPFIDSNHPLVVRHKSPEGYGLPLQVYAFCKNNQMVHYENVQSEIIEHLLAIMNQFGLKVFQQLTADDLRALSK